MSKRARALTALASTAVIACGAVLLFARGHTAVIEAACGMILILAGTAASLTLDAPWLNEPGSKPGARQIRRSQQRMVKDAMPGRRQ